MEEGVVVHPSTYYTSVDNNLVVGYTQDPWCMWAIIIMREVDFRVEYASSRLLVALEAYGE